MTGSQERGARTVTATFAGTCVGCKEPIAPGEEIEPAPYRHWHHAATGCRDQAMARYMPRRPRTDPAYGVQCPQCGAEVGELCTTDAGKKCPLHAARRDAVTGAGL